MQSLYFIVEMSYSTHELYVTRTHRIMALTQDENAAHTFVQDEIGITPEDQQIVIDHIGDTLNVVELGMFDTIEELVDTIKANERYTRRAEIK